MCTDLDTQANSYAEVATRYLDLEKNMLNSIRERIVKAYIQGYREAVGILYDVIGLNHLLAENQQSEDLKNVSPMDALRLLEEVKNAINNHKRQ